MCLSKVYLKDKDKDALIIEEAANVIDKQGTIRINTLFGEEKQIKGYSIGEINLVENYVILQKSREEKRCIIR